MNYREQVIDDHPIQKTLTDIQSKILLKKAFIESIENGEAIYARIQLVLTLIVNKLNSPLFMLFPLVSLTSLNGHITNLLNDIDAYIASGNPTNIDSRLDNIIITCMQLPQPSPETINLLSDEMNRINQEQEKRIGAQNTDLENLEAQIDSAHKTLNKLETKIDTNKTELTDAIDKFKKEAQKLITDQKAVIDSEKEKILNHANGIIISLEETQNKISDLVKIVTNASQSGHYKNRANEEKSTANFFRGTALFFMILLICSCAVIIWLSLSQFVWGEFLIRITVSTVLALPILYCMNEASAHRKLANRYNDISLQLAAIDPFLHGSEPHEILKIKQGLVPKYFGNNEEVTLQKINPLVEKILDRVSITLK